MATTRIHRTAGTPTSSKKFTISFWCKKSKLGADQFIFSTFNDANNRMQISFNDSDQLDFICKVSSSNVARLKTSRKFQDQSAFYHIVCVFDTTESTNTDRIKLYINGVRELAADNGYASEVYPSQDATVDVTGTHTIGAYHNAGSPNLYYDGLLTHVNFTDGYVYQASTFGSTDSTSGIWKPNTAPSVTYGTNGFFLKFENSGNLDLDSSNNNHTFTTAGSLTQNNDTPSNVFASWNPNINNGEDGSWSNANLTIAPNGDATYLYAPITIPLSAGKWYSEHMITGGNGYGSLGLSGASNISDIFRSGDEPGNATPSFAFRCINGGIKMNNSNTSYGSAPGTSDAILGMAVDIDNKKVWYSINGTYVTYGGGVGNPAAGTYGFDWSSLSDDFGWLHVCGDSENNGYGNFKSNFGSGFFGTTAVASANADANGHGAFEYAVPSGYYAICTKNIKEFG